MNPRVLIIMAPFLVAVPLAAQAPNSVASKPAASAKAVDTTKAWTPPRTADGHPDLQGVWSNASDVPLERPRNLGTKEFYTEQEAAEIAKRGFQGDRNPLPEAHYDLGQFGLDPTQNKFAATLRTSMIVGPDGRIPPMLPEAQKRNAERAAKTRGHELDGPEGRPLGERCIVWPKEGPPMLPSAYNNDMQIQQGAGYVVIEQEMIHDARIIPLDNRPHVPANIHEYMGDSRGHWEGNTLVVDTTNFTDKTNFRGSGKDLHVIERFTLTDANTILYEFTIDDPSTWAKPWTAQISMARTAGPIYEYACNEGNYGMANNLSAARADERRAAEAAAKSK